LQHRLQTLCGAPHQCRGDFVPILRNSGAFARPVRSLTRMFVAALALALLLALAVPESAAARWVPPVPGGLARAFDVGANPFASGQHRGVDLRAVPGAVVSAPCEGRVVVAGQVGTSGGVVTMLCDRWRVSLLPLATIAAHAGASVRRGAPVGTLARTQSHAGLHLGVRRNGTRFGYVDPLRFLGAAPTSAPPLGPAPRARRTPHPPSAVAPPHVTARAEPRPIAAPARADLPARSAPSGDLAPWPAWVGLALVLAGAGVCWRGSLRTRTRHSVGATARLNQ
jgi:peptidase M23-like protein